MARKTVRRLAVWASPSRPIAFATANDPASLLSLYRRIIWFRRSSDALRFGVYAPIDGLPAMIMGAGNYNIKEFWKCTLPQYFIRLLVLTAGALLLFPMR